MKLALQVRQTLIAKVLGLLAFGYLCYYLGESETTSQSQAQFIKASIGVKDAKETLRDDVYPILPVQEESSTKEPLCPSVSEFELENVRRLEWINSQCDNVNTERSKVSEIREMFYFPKSNLGWCPVYKACSSNVFSHFCQDYFDEETCQDKTIKMHNHKGGFRDQSQFKELGIRPEDEKRFLVVRDPFTRLLSHYRNKVELLSHPSYKGAWCNFMTHYRPVNFIHKDGTTRQSECNAALAFAEGMTLNGTEKAKVNHPKYRKPSGSNAYLYPPYPTFKEVVSGVTSGWFDNHIIPASQRCGPCGSSKKFDFLLKAESFNCDIDNMFRVTGSDRLVSKSERWSTNQTPPLNLTMFYSYYSTLSDELLDNILNLYNGDCLLFEYPCEEHVKNIKKFKQLNPDYKHEYKNTWNGRIGDWEIIS